MNDDLSDNKNIILSAISSGLPILFIIEKSDVQLGSSPVLSVKGVSISPGATQLTLISPLKYLANDFVKDIMPAFVVE